MLQRNVLTIPLDQICGNPDQPRKYFEEEALNDLANSISQYGVLQPILVTKGRNGEFNIIAGERRYRAALKAGLTKIPAVIRDLSDKDADLISLIENIQRENLSFIEEAKAYKALIEKYQLTQSEIAARLGKNQSTISNKLRILTLPEELQEQLAEGNLTERHARALLTIEGNELRKKIIERIIKNGLNVSQSEKLIKEILTRNKGLSCKRKGYISYKIYINSFKKVYHEIKKMNGDIKMEENVNNETVQLIITFPKNERCFT